MENCFRGGKVFASNPELSSVGIKADELFGNLEEVVSVAETLVAVMEAQKLRSPENNSIGRAFVANFEELKVAYLKYAANYEPANVKLHTVYMKDDRKADCIADLMEMMPGQSTDLNSFMIKPVQRIMKYPLLFKQMLNNTKPNHPDHSSRETALNKTLELIEEMNEQKRAKELVDGYIGGANSTGTKARGTAVHSATKRAGRAMQSMRKTTSNADEAKIDADYKNLWGDVKLLQSDLAGFKKAVPKYTADVAAASRKFSDYVEVVNEIYVESEYVVQGEMIAKMFDDVATASQEFAVNVDLQVSMKRSAHHAYSAF